MSTPCFSATARYMAKRIGAVELMVIEVVTSPSGIPSKRTSMSARVSTATPHFPTSPFGHRVVRVVAVEGRQVEGDGEAGLPLGEQVLEALVGVRRGAEAGELAHRPELAAIAGGVDAARVGVLAGDAERLDADRRPPPARG